MDITNLSKDQFIAQVGNFEADPTGWEYVGDIPCLIDFHAPWCGYCKRLNPLLDSLAQEYDGKIRIYKVDVDQEAALEAAFNIRTIPTLLLCPVGRPKEQLLGVLGKQELKALVEEKLL